MGLLHGYIVLQRARLKHAQQGGDIPLAAIHISRLLQLYTVLRRIDTRLLCWVVEVVYSSGCSFCGLCSIEAASLGTL